MRSLIRSSSRLILNLFFILEISFFLFLSFQRLLSFLQLLFFSFLLLSPHKLFFFLFLQHPLSLNVISIFPRFLSLSFLIVLLHELLTLVILVSLCVLLHHISHANVASLCFSSTALNMAFEKGLFEGLFAVGARLWFFSAGV